MKLSDAEVAELRAAAAGAEPAALAEQFEVTARHAERLANYEQRQTLGRSTIVDSERVLDAVDDYLDHLDLGAADRVRAETARSLAAKLDQVQASESAASASAAPRIASELLAAVAELEALHGSEPDELGELLRRREARLRVGKS